MKLFHCASVASSRYFTDPSQTGQLLNNEAPVPKVQLGHDRLQSCNWPELRAANGIVIPYISDLESALCGKVMPHCGVWVVKEDPPGC